MLILSKLTKKIFSEVPIMRMIKLKNIAVTPSEIEEIKLAMKNTTKLRLYKRYSILLKHFNGFTNREIASVECLDPHTVGVYINNYKRNGLAGLKIGYSTGAKRKLNSMQEQILVDTIINKTPDNLGFESKKNWTIEIVRQWVIKEFGVKMCHKGIAVVLHRLNLSYTRPTYVLRKADKEKQEYFKNDFCILKKNISMEK